MYLCGRGHFQHTVRRMDKENTKKNLELTVGYVKKSAEFKDD